MRADTRPPLLTGHLCLPKQWAADHERRAQAGVPETVAFQTKPALAIAMPGCALDAGVPCRWVTGDAVYGGDRTLRCKLEQRRQAFVLGVACEEPLWRDGPVCRPARELVYHIAFASRQDMVLKTLVQ